MATNDIITIYKNRHKTLRATITGPGDLTGALVWFSVKNKRSDLDANALILKKSANNNGSDSEAIVSDGPNGVIDIFLVPADTSSLTPTEYWFDIVIELAGQKMQAVEPRALNVKEAVTKA